MKTKLIFALIALFILYNAANAQTDKIIRNGKAIKYQNRNNTDLHGLDKTKLNYR